MHFPYIIGISGGSGAGKSTFVRALRDRFDDRQMAIVTQDDYYKERNRQKLDDHQFRNFDRPASIKRKKLLADLLALRGGNAVQIIEYTFNNADKNGTIKSIQPAPVMIVEGLFVLHFEQVRALMDLVIFVDARTETKIIRRITRDRQERNYPLDDVLYRYAHHVTPAYKKYIEPYREKADILVNGNKDFHSSIEVISAFIRHKINSYTSTTKPN